MIDKPFILLKDDIAGEQLLFENPIEVITATTLLEFFEALDRLESARNQNLWSAGFISYEAGYLFEEKLTNRFNKKRKKSKVPLLCFGIFKQPEDKAKPIFKKVNTKKQKPILSNFRAGWDFETYRKKFKVLHKNIAEGNCYQGNLTFPVYADYKGDPLDIFQQLAKKQAVKYSALVNLNETPILSRSPELFFKVDEKGNIEAHPMKGTAPRYQDPIRDAKSISNLQSDPKTKAENIMIVDLLRNDISRIATVGSVKVPKVYEVETYPTLHQMISKVVAKLQPGTSIAEILRALFPCGSITGAPKISSMEILDELEDTPRDVYCGAIGYIGPGAKMQFNVAIRTITLFPNNLAQLNVGGGVVWGSTAESEYDEAMLKAKYATQGQFIQPANFSLIETLRLSKEEGFIRLNLHLDRLENSATELGFKFDKASLLDRLNKIPQADFDQRIRIELTPKGNLKIQAERLHESKKIFRIAIAKSRLSSANFVLKHKTSKRGIYDQARAEYGKDLIEEVILENERGEICEGVFTNIFIRKRKGDLLLTPPLHCGLLEGVLRRESLENGIAKEAIITRQDLTEATEIFVGNSLRGFIKAEFSSKKREQPQTINFPL